MDHALDHSMARPCEGAPLLPARARLDRPTPVEDARCHIDWVDAFQPLANFGGDVSHASEKRASVNLVAGIAPVKTDEELVWIIGVIIWSLAHQMRHHFNAGPDAHRA
eukprot:2620243-Pyramimonas_sp.AAC.1